MAFVPSFTVTQGSDITTFSIEDSSSGTDAAITVRWIYLQLSDGSYLVPSGTTTDYIVFPIVSGIGDTIDLEVLNTDYAISITVQWRSNVASLYSSSEDYGFSNYQKQELYNLTSTAQASNPTIIKDETYLMSKLKLFESVVSGDNAIEQGADISSAQQCYDRGLAIVANSNFYF